MIAPAATRHHRLRHIRRNHQKEILHAERGRKSGSFTFLISMLILIVILMILMYHNSEHVDMEVRVLTLIVSMESTDLELNLQLFLSKALGQ